MSEHTMTCAAFGALASDYIEAHALAVEERSKANAHVAGCVECAALVADLRAIVRDARELPVLAPSIDLWAGIEERIQAPVLPIVPWESPAGSPVAELPNAEAGARFATPSWRRLAIAASLLVVATAGITYEVTKQGAVPQVAATNDSMSQLRQSAVGSSGPAVGLIRPASHPSAEETFDKEIASLRKIVAARRGELDTATVRIVEKNLKLIDAAIAESKSALANDPASSFLTDRLTQAYDTKLQFLRGLATLPPRT